jgi:hypothetical protein
MQREEKKWTMQIEEADTGQSDEILLYDGKRFQYENFAILQKVCGCEEFIFKGKVVYDDNDTYINVNDDVMDGITEENPAGRWNDDKTVWSWGTHINNNYVVFRYYV